MGRVYDIRPDTTRGERSGWLHRVHLFGPKGRSPRKLKFVQRVEFDDEADEGMATLTVIMTDADGNPLPESNSDAKSVVRATFRCCVCVVEIPRDQPARVEQTDTTRRDEEPFIVMNG